MSSKLYAAVEAGGTKVLCGLATAEGQILAQDRIPTRAPLDTIADIEAFFRSAVQSFGAPSAAGIASFGPIDLDAGSPSYGRITSTPKPGWTDFDILGAVRAILGVPTTIDTDVNCAAMAEGLSGAGIGLSQFCYVTVGTGIGVGIVENGRTRLANGHPEVGHIRLPRAPADDFAGNCSFHGDCAEGLASGPAMKARWNMSAEDLPADHRGWEIEAHYIAALCVNLTYILRPQRIVIGGGVLQRSTLIKRVRAHFEDLTGGYAHNQWSRNSQTYIVEPKLVDPSPGLVGALELAREIDRAR